MRAINYNNKHKSSGPTAANKHALNYGWACVYVCVSVCVRVRVVIYIINSTRPATQLIDAKPRSRPLAQIKDTQFSLCLLMQPRSKLIRASNSIMRELQGNVYLYPAAHIYINMYSECRQRASP